MKFRKTREIETPQFMIIPMIDIIFFLLVFFMMSSLHTSAQLAVQLPQAAQADSVVQQPVVITIDQAGRVTLDAQPVSLDQAAAALRARTADNPQLPVILQADQATSHGQVVAVMDMLKAAGVKKLGIAAEKKAG